MEPRDLSNLMHLLREILAELKKLNSENKSGK